VLKISEKIYLQDIIHTVIRGLTQIKL